MAQLADLLSKEKLTQFERTQIHDRLLVQDAQLANMRKLLDQKSPEVWGDYAPLSSYTGWSSFYYQYINYVCVGSMVHIWFFIDGVSNSDLAIFTLPYKVNTRITYTPIFPIRGKDNSVMITIPGAVQPIGLNAYCYIDWMSGGVGWTASGEKYVLGYMVYQRAM